VLQGHFSGYPSHKTYTCQNAVNLCTGSTTQSNRGTHVAIHGNHQTAPEGESLLHWILTAHVTRAHLHVPELKRRSTEWHHQATTCPQKYQQEQGQL